jgi:hypothetical protein
MQLQRLKRSLREWRTSVEIPASEEINTTVVRIATSFFPIPELAQNSIIE